MVAARVTTMFLRSSVVKKGGKTYRYWKLVENVRTDTGPRQQVVAHLGDLSNFTAADWQVLAGRMGEPEMGAALQRRVRPEGPRAGGGRTDRGDPAGRADAGMADGALVATDRLASVIGNSGGGHQRRPSLPLPGSGSAPQASH